MDVVEFMATLFACALLGLLPGFIAKSKGRSFFGFWILGTFLFVLAVAIVIRLENRKELNMRQKNEYGDYQKLYKERKITRKQLKDKKDEIFGKKFYDWQQ